MKYFYILTVIFIISCNNENETVINQKVISLDKKYVASIETEYSGGAAGSVATIVNISKNDNGSKEKKLILKALHTKNMYIYWLNEKTLVISYQDMDILSFSNKDYFDTFNAKYLIEIILEKRK